MSMLSMACLRLDLHAYVFFSMFILRSICLCLDLCVMRSMPCFCAYIYMLVDMPCASIAFLSFDISISCVLALIGGV